ncbi:MAG: DUF1698 domain-containing protein [Bacteroidales bacterium]
MNTVQHLSQLFKDNYSLDQLKNISKKDFIISIESHLNTLSNENFIDVSKQRDLSLKFHWGHNHDFGENFYLTGNMKNRHIEIIASFIDDFGLPLNLSDKKILDIGVWTGGTSILLAALGAEVFAIEEVIQYSEMVNFLAKAFDIDKNLKCYSMSLYEFLPMFADFFDYIIYSGVIYHVTDPLLSLREIFTALKNNGTVFLETYGIDEQESICIYEGPNIFSTGNHKDLNRGGWNYFIPSPLCLSRWCHDAGFQIVQIGEYKNKRIIGSATRTNYQDICRAGISKKDLR